VGLLALAGVGAALFGCSQDVTSPTSPVDRISVGDLKGASGEFSLKEPQVLRVVEIQNRWTPKLMAIARPSWARRDPHR